MKDIVLGVIGNPNCGKSTLFNALTGAKQHIGNWPGVTVDRKSGSFTFQGRTTRVVDTPGIYSLAASSLDEKVTRDFVLSREADVIVNIVDASNIERNLYLTSQLLEMRAPMLVALNMMDMAAEKRIKIDVEALAKRLGCPVIPMSAAKGRGIDDLKRAILTAPTEPPPLPDALRYPAAIDEARAEIVKLVGPDACAVNKIDADWLALKLLENDSDAARAVTLTDAAAATVRRLQQSIEEKEGEESDVLIASARYGFISSLLAGIVKKEGRADAALSERIDRIALNRVWGIPIFLLAMYLMFMITINFGGAFIDFFDQAAAAIFVDGLGKLLEAVGAPEWLVVLLANGIGGGIQTMATFIPPIGFMFLCLSFLEDSGYMARAAFVMDRCMRFIGLPGKAFVPMLVGFGCNVPAIMATRTLENERDRTLTVMMNPFMSCGARLPVFALFAVVFFPEGGQNIVFLLYLIGIAFAVLTGLVLKNTLLKGEVTPFIMEMPPYHLPTVRSVLLRAYDRLQSFMFRAGRVLIPVIMALSILNSLGTDGTFGNEDSENSVLATVSKSISPVLRPLGVTEENWPAALGIFTGIFAKEAVVGTLDSLYTGMDKKAEESGEEAEEAFEFWPAIGAAFATIPENLKGLADTVTDPLGLSIGTVEDQEVAETTITSMERLFGGASAAFAYMLFVLLYFPCSAAIAAVYRETTLAWTVFAGFWTTFLAYIAATSFYQLANYAANPGTATMILAFNVTAFVVVFLVMKAVGGRAAPTEIPALAMAGRHGA
ncbi:MAG: Fe(2+) transporter permease subunit FeoB [Desulfobulbaceae bacterium]|jgi:ferrous iron transport protein B|nr:Fe(2+) transporter permease subunit FeoB [Desulfobulbaceae bacterium]